MFGGKKLPPSSGRTKVPASFSEILVITYGRTEPQHEYITNRAASFLILDEIKTNEMGRARRTCGKQEKCIQGFCGVSGGRDRLEDPGVDGMILLKLVFKKWDGGLDWTNLAQDRDRWRAVVNAVMNLRVQ